MYIASGDKNDHLAVAYELQKHLEPLLLVSIIDKFVALNGAILEHFTPVHSSHVPVLS